MNFKEPLIKARLIKRYKRFLADIVFDSQEQRTIHCANTGAMTGCAEEGVTVWYSTSDNPKRKYPNSWELTKTQKEHWICVNTQQANKLAVEAINKKVVKELTDYESLQTEVKYGSENSRIDILLSSKNKPMCYVEVKSVTLLDESVATTPCTPNIGQGYFPDAKTARGTSSSTWPTSSGRTSRIIPTLKTRLPSGRRRRSRCRRRSTSEGRCTVTNPGGTSGYRMCS